MGVSVGVVVVVRLAVVASVGVIVGPAVGVGVVVGLAVVVGVGVRVRVGVGLYLTEDPDDDERGLNGRRHRSEQAVFSKVMSWAGRVWEQQYLHQRRHLEQQPQRQQQQRLCALLWS